MESHYAFLPSTLDMFAEFMTMLAFRLELYPVYPPACTSFAHLGFSALEVVGGVTVAACLVSYGVLTTTYLTQSLLLADELVCLSSPVCLWLRTTWLWLAGSYSSPPLSLAGEWLYTIGLRTHAALGKAIWALRAASQ